MAEELVDNQMVDFISSDMHHPRHAAAFEDAYCPILKSCCLIIL
jgi:tyrosine-protein phosphatase YwqE